MTSAFELAEVNHYYGSYHALKDITVDVGTGTVGLLGPNGAGKTTLIKTLLGLLDPYSGDGKVLGADVRTDIVNIHRRVGYMAETEAVFSDLTGFESVVYTARLAGLPRTHAIRRAHEVLDFAGMDEERYRPCTGYSTGMKQRVKLAQALVHGPELVFLDEPTNGLDPQGREDMLALIDQLADIGTSVLLSSHLLHDVEKVCDHVLVLVDGSIRHYGAIAELTEGRSGQYDVRVKSGGDRLAGALTQHGWTVEPDPESDNRMLISLAEGDHDRFWKTAVELGVQVRHFTPVRLSLEHAFVRLLEGA